jgi:hypothetical protein
MHIFKKIKICNFTWNALNSVPTTSNAALLRAFVSRHSQFGAASPLLNLLNHFIRHINQIVTPLLSHISIFKTHLVVYKALNSTQNGMTVLCRLRRRHHRPWVLFIEH